MPVAESASAGILTKLMASTLGRVLRLRPEIERHNRELQREYEDIWSWVTDEDRELREELDTVDEEANKENLFYSSTPNSNTRERSRRL